MKKGVEISLGDKYNMLTVLEKLPPDKYGIRVKCLCDCGKTMSVHANAIKNGNTKSCGCYRTKKLKMPRSHGHCVNGVSGEYKAYFNMINRCYDVKNKQYKDYGQRGITVCQNWLNSFNHFIQDMGKKPTPKHSIDRIDNEGNYEPSNCQWATDKAQRRNKRNNVWVEYNGNTKIMSDWAIELGTNYVNLRKHIKRGKTFEQAYLFYKNKSQIINNKK